MGLQVHATRLGICLRSQVVDWGIWPCRQASGDEPDYGPLEPVPTSGDAKSNEVADTELLEPE